MGEFDPYQAPADLVDESAAEQPASFRSLRGLCTALTMLLCVSIAGSLLEMTLASSQQSGALEVGTYEAVSSVELATLWTYLLQVPAFVLFAIFLYRSNVNARALDLAQLTYSPASMIWWYAVPIANLWKPYQAFRQVWDASLSDRLHTPNALLPIWWGAWLISNISARATLRENPSAAAVLFHCVSHIAAAACAIFVVRALTLRQERSFSYVNRSS